MPAGGEYQAYGVGAATSKDHLARVSTKLENAVAANVIADHVAYVLMKHSVHSHHYAELLEPFFRDVVSALTDTGYHLVALPDKEK